AKRFVVLVLGRSFYGREDPTLLRAILPELTGILNWALEGLDRLHARGQFMEPAASRDSMRALEDLASPIAAFIRDRCHVGPTERAPMDDLWINWKEWCTDQGQPSGTKETFGRDLRAAMPGLRKSQPRVDGIRR